MRRENGYPVGTPGRTAQARQRGTMSGFRIVISALSGLFVGTAYATEWRDTAIIRPVDPHLGVIQRK